MTTLLSVLFFLLLPLIIVCMVLGRLIETQRQQIRRLCREGVSQRAIAQQLGISRHKVRLALA